MKYRELLEALQKATEEELDQTVTVDLLANDEFVPVVSLLRIDEDDADRLDVGHIVLVVED